MVAYLLLIGFVLSILVVGASYMASSDFVDLLLSAINSYNGTQLQGQMDSDSIQTGNFLMMLLKYILIPSLFVLIYWILVMSQKPVRPY